MFKANPARLPEDTALVTDLNLLVLSAQAYIPSVFVFFASRPL